MATDLSVSVSDEPGGLAKAAEALGAAGVADAVLRLYWTAGRERSDRPTTLALVSRISEHIEPLRARGIALIALQLGYDPHVRAQAPWLLGGVKSTSYAVNMAADREREERHRATASRSGAPIAARSGRAFTHDSSISAAGSESHTMPPPTQRWIWPSATANVRIVRARSRSPLG